MPPCPPTGCNCYLPAWWMCCGDECSGPPYGCYDFYTIHPWFSSAGADCCCDYSCGPLIILGECDNWQWWGIHYLVFEEEEYEGHYDIQWHSTNMDVANLIRWWSDGSTREITWGKPRSQQAVGSYVCKYGRTTHYTAGYIASKTYEPYRVPDSEPTFILVDNTGAYDDLSDPGDSGGPWFLGNYAYDTHSGGLSNGDAFYMAIDYLSGIDVSLLTD